MSKFRNLDFNDTQDSASEPNLNGAYKLEVFDDVPAYEAEYGTGVEGSIFFSAIYDGPFFHDGSTWKTVESEFNAYGQAAVPAITNDETENFNIGSVWEFDSRFWICKDNTTGAAVWIEFAQNYDQEISDLQDDVSDNATAIGDNATAITGKASKDLSDLTAPTAIGVDLTFTTGGVKNADTIEVVSTSKGSTPHPKVTTIERDAITGMVQGEAVYNTDTDTIDTYDGAAWKQIGANVFDQDLNTTDNVEFVSVKLSGMSGFASGQQLLMVDPSGNIIGAVNPADLYWNEAAGSLNIGGGSNTSPLSVNGNAYVADNLRVDGDIEIQDFTTMNRQVLAPIFQAYSTLKASLPFPKMTTAQRDAAGTPSGSISNGWGVYNTDTLQFEYYNGTAWVAIAGNPFDQDLNMANSVTFDTINATTGLVASNIRVDSTTKGSTPFPKMTEVQRDAILIPLEGQGIYNETSKEINIYDGAAWVAVGGGGGGGADTELSNLTNPTTVSQSLTPISTDTKDLGTDSKRWQFVYANVLDVSGGGQVEGGFQFKDQWTGSYSLRVQGNSGTVYKGRNIYGFVRGETAQRSIAFYTVDGSSTGDLIHRSGDATGFSSGKLYFESGDAPNGGQVGNMEFKVGTLGGAIGTKGEIIFNATEDNVKLTNHPSGTVDESVASVKFVNDSLASAGGPDLINKNVHGFEVLDSIYHDGIEWLKAKADAESTLAQYTVVEVVDANNFKVAKFGQFDGLVAKDNVTADGYYHVKDNFGNVRMYKDNVLLIADIGGLTNYGANNVCVGGDIVLFSYYDGVNPKHYAWNTDTLTGSIPFPTTGGTFNKFLNGKFYFRTDSKLYEWDGVSASATEVFASVGGNVNYNPLWYTHSETTGKMYFRAWDSSSNARIYEWDYVSASPTLALASINGVTNYSADRMTFNPVRNTLVFKVNDTVYGDGFWKWYEWDFTNPATVVFTSVGGNANFVSGLAGDWGHFNGNAYFAAEDTTGVRLYEWDNVSASPTLVFTDISGDTSYMTGPNEQMTLDIENNIMHFVAETGGTGGYYNWDFSSPAPTLFVTSGGNSSGEFRNNLNSAVGEFAYLSQTTDGDYTYIKPTSGFSAPLFYVENASTIHMNLWEATDLDAAGGGASVPKFQTKTLVSDQTVDGVMADLTFNNLTVGKTYRISGKFYIQHGIADYSINILVYHDGNIIDVCDTSGDSVVTQTKTATPNTVFTATGTQVYFQVGSVGGGSKITGGSSVIYTYITLEEHDAFDVNTTW